MKLPYKKIDGFRAIDNTPLVRIGQGDSLTELHPSDVTNPPRPVPPVSIDEDPEPEPPGWWENPIAALLIVLAFIGFVWSICRLIKGG